MNRLLDNTNLFLSFKTATLNGVIETFNTIYYNIGLKVNYDKTRIYRIGSLARSDAKIYTTKNFIWSSKSVEILGITIDNETTTVSEINYNVAIQKSEEYVTAMDQPWSYTNG